MDGLAGERILLGVSGGIAAYKAADLARRLIDAGARVQVVMTDAAQQFVTPTTFQALTGEPVRTSLWDAAGEAAMGHIELARWATRIVVAPASADFIARVAHGLANDLLSTLCLATDAPITLVPAMNRLMWSNAATTANVALLRERGIGFLGPGEGAQACGEVGAGRMLEPQEIVQALVGLGIGSVSGSALAGKRVLVTAGPTYEDLDPVRYLGNRSSGKMGFALAAQAASMGAEVLLVSGPVALPTPAGVTRVDVRRAVQMRDAVIAALPGTHVFIAAAAVADYMPATTSSRKIKKSAGPASLELVRTPDVLREVAGHAQRPALVVGFAAETEDVELNAKAKLADKGADLIAANDVAAQGLGFESDENALIVFGPGLRREIPRAPKPQVARGLLQLVAELLETRR